MRRKTYAYNGITIGVLLGLLAGVSTENIAIGVAVGIASGAVCFVAIRALERLMWKGVDKGIDKAADTLSKKYAERNQHSTPQNQRNTLPPYSSNPNPFTSPNPRYGSTNQSIRNCRNCGAPLKNGALFCVKCGMKIGQ